MKRQKSWLSPLTIPQNKIKKYAIEHITIPIDSKVLFNTSRNIFLGGQKAPSFISYNIPTTWHKLVGPTGTWMTDMPIEQRQAENLLRGMSGRVLVGGLGLGLAATILARKKSVKEIIIVEKSKEVIDLVYKHLNNRHKISILHQDLFKFLKNWQKSEDPFDYAFYDIWQSDGEATFHSTVVPLHQLSKDIVKTRPICWNEDVMRGQLIFSLKNRLLFLSPEAISAFPEQNKLVTEHPWWEPLDKPDIFWDWAIPFWSWWKKAQPERKKATKMAQHYATIYGLRDWQSAWTIATL